MNINNKKMKNLFTQRIKILFLSIIMIGFANTSSFGQSDTQTDQTVYKDALTLGITHSFVMSTISGDFPSNGLDNIDNKISMLSPRYTLDFGMTADYFINEKVSVQLDFVYTYIGAKFVEKNFLYNEIGKIEKKDEFTLSTHYFKLPLTINYYPKDKLYINGGGYFAPLVSAQKYRYWSESSADIIEANPFDYGIVAGFGFNLPYAKVGFQYSYGLSNFRKEEGYDLHHSVFQMIVRWKFYSDIRNNKRNL